MQLILMRHALAEERSERWPDDSLRPLTSEGERKHRLVSAALRRMDVTFDTLISSPLTRARQTADITAEVYGRKDAVIESDALGRGYSVEALAEFLGGFDDDSTLLCVGHEPDLSGFSAHLLHRSGDVSIEFKKSGVMGLAISGAVRPGAAMLLYFFKPGHLARLGRK
ncbi:MAG: histidine phosphatase family protein [Gemmatimonadetes bacterium]|nr:histidine phosphatase family protein [Gemmatimonadota bacterium]